MSPLRRDRLLVFIGPGRISLIRLARGLRPRVLVRRDEAVDAADLCAPWHALSGRLAQVLADPAWQAADADVVLSNKLVRHAVVPFNAQLKKYAEREAYARHALAGVYGPAAAQWELRIHGQARGRKNAGAPSLVGAVERGLLESLRQALAAQKIELRSVTSRLMLACNHHRKAMQADPAWLVMHEPGHSQFTLVGGGNIIALHGTSHRDLQELPRLLDRENLASAAAEPCRAVYLDVPEGHALPPIPSSAYSITALDPLPPQACASRGARWPWRSRHIALDFGQAAERPNRNAGWMLLAAGLALAVEIGVSYAGLYQERAEMERDIAATKLKLDEPAPDPRDARYTDKDLEAAKQIVNRLSTPWNEFFTGLESVSNKQAAVLSIVPEMQTGMLRVVGEAKDYPALLTLLAQLRATKPFSQVYLGSQQTRRDDPQHPVMFVIYMHWMKPA